MKGADKKEWEDCPPFGGGLIENIFFPFKTPIEEESSSFCIKAILDRAQEKEYKLGLWVDLTGSTKYYCGSKVESEKIKYVKLPIKGGACPTKLQINAFITECTKFVRENPGHVIGIHCTHGFNRTGYLICSYLARVKKFDAHEALDTFARFRPPGIYRQPLVNELIMIHQNWRGPNKPIPRVHLPPWDQDYLKEDKLQKPR